MALKSLLLASALCVVSGSVWAGSCTTSTTFNTNGSSTGAFASNSASSLLEPCNILTDLTNAQIFPNVAAFADATANPTGSMIGAYLFGFNGTTWDRMRSDSSQRLEISPNTLTLGQGVTTASANGSLVLDRAQSSEPTAATSGDTVTSAADLTGKTITSPYANRENMVRGAASATNTSATTIIAAAGSGIKNYITDLECGRNDTGTTPILLTLNDSATTVLVLPNAGNGAQLLKTFEVPLATAANTAFTFTSGSSITTVYCNAQGFTGY